MSQLFISHSSRNNAEAVALRDWMSREGWSDVFLDVDPQRGIAAGERWERALNLAAKRCEAVLFLVSRDWLTSGWCLKEFGLAHKLNKRLFGLLIEDIPVGDLPVNLTSTWQFVNLAAGRDHVMLTATLPVTQDETHVTFSSEGLIRLRHGLRRAGLDPSVFAWPPTDDPKRSPYPGLRPLEVEDAGIFFGREAPTIEVLDRMRALRDAAAPRLFCILGASGSGKSSFLRAGLWPRLASDDRSFLPLPVLRPERNAISGKSGLLSVLTGACEATGLATPRAEIREAIDGGAETLRPLLARVVDEATALETGEAPSRAPLLVLPIDQGEELFLAESAAEADALLGLLHDLLIEDAPALAILMTIRSDAVERLQLAPALDGIDPLTMTLSPMPRGVYGTIIEGPAARMREAERPLAIDPALTRALLDDMEAGGARDALPLLAFTLERLWLDYGTRGRLTLTDYDRLGRVRGSIEAAIEEALLKADADPGIPRDRAARLAVLRRGLVPWLAGIDAETGSPRRRVARRQEIPEEARPLINRLVEERLLSADVDPATGEATIEPAHEALLRQWGLLQGWLEEDFGALAAIEGVRRAARDWGANARDAAWLAHGSARLAEVERLSDRPDLTAQFGSAERDYLAACRIRADRDAANERQRARQRRWLQGGSLAAALIFAVLGLVAGLQWREAVAQRAVATERAADAERQKTLAQEQEQKALDNQTAALSALSSATLSTSPAVATKLALAAWPRDARDRTPKLDVTLTALGAAVSQLRERAIFSGHAGLIRHTAFSRDGTKILTASDDGTARLWDTKSGAVLATFQGHEGRVISAVFSPNEAHVLTASIDGTARLWNCTTGEPTLVFDHHGGWLRSAVFAPDGTRILTASDDGFARVWDAASGKLLASTEMRTGPVRSAVFSRDGLRMLTASDNDARMWDAATGRSLAVFSGHKDRVNSAVFSLDGSRVLTASDDDTTQIWDTETSRSIVTLAGHKGPVREAVFSADGSRILTTSDQDPVVDDNTARLWDATTGRMISVLQWDSSPVVDAAFSPDGSRVLTASWASDIVPVWATASGKLLTVFSLRDRNGARSSIGVSPDGSRLITTDLNNVAKLWDIAAGGPLAMLQYDTNSVQSAAFSPDGTHAATASDDGTAVIWDLAAGTEPLVLKGHSAKVSSVIYSRDGSRILTISEDKTARLWNAITADCIAVLTDGENDLRSARFSPDGSRVATTWFTKSVKFWDAVTGRPLFDLQTIALTNDAIFSPDSAQVLTIAVDTAQLWALASGRPLALFQGHTATINSVDFLNDGTRILTASLDHTIRIWESLTGKLLKIIDIHKGNFTDAVFSPDGTRILSDSLDGTTRLWDTSGSPLAELQSGDGWHLARFSPDGNRVVTAAFDNTVKLWDVATGQIVGIMRGHDRGVTSVVFSPDGARLLTSSMDGTARVWDLSTIPRGNLFQVACAWLPDTDLSEIAEDYGLTGLTRICQGDVPLPDLPAP